MSTRNYVDGAWYNQYNDAHWFACITTDGSRVILIPYKLRMRNDGSINTNYPDGKTYANSWGHVSNDLFDNGTQLVKKLMCMMIWLLNTERRLKQINNIYTHGSIFQKHNNGLISATMKAIYSRAI